MYKRQTRSTSNLVETTITYFKAIEENVKGEKELDYAKSVSEELITDWAKVLEEPGGIEEAQNALKILEETYKTIYQSKQENPCLKQFKSCVIGTLKGLVEVLVEGANINEAIDAAWVSILGCLVDHMKCMM